MKRHPAAVSIAIPLLLSLHGAVRAAPALVWSDIRDGGAHATDQATAAAIDPSSGDLIIGGEARDGIAGADMLVRRLDRATGGEVWAFTWGVAPDANDMALTGIVNDGSGNVCIGGTILGCPT